MIARIVKMIQKIIYQNNVIYNLTTVKTLLCIGFLGFSK
jgi:hypothetical protein